MALSFICSGCKAEIVTRHLKTGEQVLCRHCGTYSEVPDDAKPTANEATIERVPLPSGFTLKQPESRFDPDKRPRGISILAIVLTISGAGSLLLVLIVASGLMTQYDPSRVPVSPVVLVWWAMYMGALWVGAGIGLWKRRVWGWWTATIAILNSAAGALLVLILMWSNGDLLAAAGMNSDRLVFYNTKYVGRFMFGSYIYTLMYSKRVLAYFRIERSDALRESWKQIATAIILILIGWALGLEGLSDL
jgi:hypothetical protein